MAVEQLFALVEIFVACFLFGSLFVPVKRFNPGDGLFAQFLMCLAIFLVGFGCFAYNEFEGFYPLAMLGGVSWCLGNLMALPIINILGLGLSLLLFSITNCLTNFLVGTFGLLGLKARPAETFWLNLVGMCLVLIGGAMISFVKTKPSELMQEHGKLSDSNSVPSTHSMEAYLSAHDEETSRPKLSINSGNERSRKLRRILAIVFALLSGILYGLLQVPIIAIQDHPELFKDAPLSGLPYCFSHFTGILLTSTAAFVVYAICKKSSPSLNPEIVLPSLLAGLMWGTAMTITIVCTEQLSQAITGPITAMLPGCIATIYSVYYFREIETGRNLYLLWSAISVTVIGAICIGLSKMEF